MAATIHKHQMSGKQKTPKTQQEIRQERLDAAMRANLGRRKQQIRARDTQKSAPHSANHPDSSPATR